ncbi:hypothetical protein ACO0LF_00720 [Undibacterium sp. Di27W]|uniref:hypothetical protein n=1 Tax=Undibacterium sp. Di27W TaxID=3413036 RepID=UPI003BF3BDCD
MSEVVHVALNRLDGGIHWPGRCPACGATGRLSNVKAYIVRSTGSYNVVSVSIGEQVSSIDFPMCATHASSNEWALTLLEGGVFMTVLRSLVYFSLFLSCFFLYQKLAHHMVLLDVANFLGIGKVGTIIFFVFGWLGYLTVLWAKRNANVRPLKFKENGKVLAIRFLNRQYAADFKRANPRATQKLRKPPTTFFGNAWFWIVLCIVAAPAALFYLMKA